MNKQRRKALDTLYRKIEELRQEVEEVMDEEQDSYDNLPENLQGSERGEAMYEAIDNLDSACRSLDEAMDYILEAV